MGTCVSYDIVLSGENAQWSISGKAQIMWKNDEGRMGILFIEMGREAFTFIRKIIEMNLGDADEVEKELVEIFRGKNFIT